MTTAQRVKAVIVDTLSVHENEVTPEATINDDLGADSLDTVELVQKLEDEFNRSFHDLEYGQGLTVQQLTDYVEQRVSTDLFAAEG